MRTLGASAAEVAKLQGSEPVTVVGIQWNSAGQITYYGDREMDGIKGRILSMGAVTNSLDEKWTQTISDVSVTLADPEGELRNIFNENDIHKIPATVYQTFGNLGLSGIFPITPQSQITSPITYDETARTLSFNITTQIETPDAGFSSESASLERTNDDDYKDWPMAFGDVLYVPAAELDINPVGKLGTAFGYADPLLALKIDIFKSRNRLLFAQYAGVIAYDTATLNMVPPALDILRDYIALIGQHDAIGRECLSILYAIETIDAGLKRANGDKAIIADLERRKKALATSLQNAGIRANQVVAKKETVRDAISGIELERQIHKENVDKLSAILLEIHKNNQELGKLINEYDAQKATQLTTIQIQNGSKFPQNTATEIFIKDMRYQGKFSGDTFTLTSNSGLQKYGRVNVNKSKGKANKFVLAETDDFINLTGLYCLVWADSINTDGVLAPGWHVIHVERQQVDTCIFTQVERRIPDPPEPPTYSGSGPARWAITGMSEVLLQQARAFPIDDEERRNIITLENLHALELIPDIPEFVFESTDSKYIVDGENIHYIAAASPIFLGSWATLISMDELQSLNVSGLIYNEAGSDVTLATPYDIYYIANIVPSQIVAVHAYKKTALGSTLTKLPKRLYTVHSAVNLNGLTVSAVSLKRRLDAYDGLNFENKLYVSMRSSVGPSPPDIISWLLSTYTNYTLTGSTGTTWANYPMDFAVFGRQNTLDLVKEIAYQARCGIYVKGNEIQLVYLSGSPTVVDTITNDDIYLESLSLEISETENLNTKSVVKWRKDYLDNSERTMVLRHNITKYGSKEEQHDYFALTNRDLVEKTATFWLIRNSNSWKSLRFSTPLTKLALEPYDGVNLNITTAVETFNCVGVITQADYNSDTNQIDFTVWLPIKTGTIDVYDLAFPSTAPGNASFPTQAEISSGNAGTGMTVEGALTQIIQGASYTSSRPLDWGREFMNDSADSPPTSQLESGNMFAIEDQIPPTFSTDTFYMPPYPDNLRDIESSIKENRPVWPIRHAYVGFITEGGPRIYKVSLHTGQLVSGELVRYVDGDAFLRIGDAVIVILGNQPDSYLIYAKPPIYYTRQAIVKTVLDDFLICENEESEETFLVARSFEFWRSNYDLQTINDWEYEYTAPNARTLRKANENNPEEPLTTVYQYIEDYYTPGKKIVIGYMTWGLSSPLDGDTNWIDLNVDGKSWKYVSPITAVVDKSTDTPWVICSITDSGEYARARSRVRPAGYKYFEGALLYLTFDPINMQYICEDLYNYAQTIVLRMTTDLNGPGSHLTGMLDRYWDGVQPLEVEISFKNPYGITAKASEYVMCEKQKNGDYLAVSRVGNGTKIVLFTLDTDLDPGGSALATDENNDPITVFDVLDMFTASAGHKGFARWSTLTNQYEVIQIKPFVLATSIVVTLTAELNYADISGTGNVQQAFGGTAPTSPVTFLNDYITLEGQVGDYVYCVRQDDVYYAIEVIPAFDVDVRFTLDDNLSVGGSAAAVTQRTGAGDNVPITVYDTAQMFHGKAVDGMNGFAKYKFDTNQYEIYQMAMMARVAVFRIKTNDLNYNDASNAGDVIYYYDGKDPTANYTTFYNELGLEGDTNDYAVCHYGTDNAYHAVEIVPAKELTIYFTLTTALSAGGSATATTSRGITVTVIDVLGKFDAPIGITGYAIWRFNNNRYEIIQCGPGLAKGAVFSLNSDLTYDDSYGVGVPHQWFDGQMPDSPTTFTTQYLIEGDAGDYVYCAKLDGGTYAALYVIPAKDVEIKFQLYESNLTRGGSAQAKTIRSGALENNVTVTVYDTLKLGPGKSSYNTQGYARWKFDWGRYEIYQINQFARVAIFKITSDDLLWVDTTNSGTIEYWYDGINPTASFNTFESPFKIEADVGDYVYCVFGDDFKYYATHVIPDKDVDVRFTLTGTLSPNGSASATTDREGTVTVYETLGKFKGKSGDKGLAKWRFDANKYEIYALSGGGLATGLLVSLGGNITPSSYTASGTIIHYWDGSLPTTPTFGVSGGMGTEANAGDHAVFNLTDEATETYALTSIIYKQPLIINFTLSGTLSPGGSASVSGEYGTVTVYDNVGVFESTSGTKKGVARWCFSNERYEIIQMECDA